MIKQSVSLPGSVDGLQNRDLGDELRKLKVSLAKGRAGAGRR